MDLLESLRQTWPNAKIFFLFPRLWCSLTRFCWPMEQNKTVVSRLFSYSVLEVKDEIDEVHGVHNAWAKFSALVHAQRSEVVKTTKARGYCSRLFDVLSVQISHFHSDFLSCHIFSTMFWRTACYVQRCWIWDLFFPLLHERGCVRALIVTWVVGGEVGDEKSERVVGVETDKIVSWGLNHGLLQYDFAHFSKVVE